ncbi:uncharacterized protein LOC136071063 isoform X2 [Quercus suber]|uniref:uncharacterized protein LOC136071063 isoform X2 n=1 Tax=Quercus suber TaxID=58331 RepID=UPI0032DE6EF6
MKPSSHCQVRANHMVSQSESFSGSEGEGPQQTLKRKSNQTPPLLVKQTESGIYINQAKYARNLVKRFGLDKAAHARTPMAANAKLTIDPSASCLGRLEPVGPFPLPLHPSFL